VTDTKKTGTVAIKKNAKGENRYYAVISGGVDPETGRRKREWSRAFETEEEAQRERHQIERDIEDQSHVAPKNVTVKSFLEDWIEGVQLRPSTIDSYRRNIVNHVIPELGKVKLQSLTALHLNKLYRKLEKSGRLSPRTVRYIHTIISCALRDAKKERLVKFNVAHDAAPPTAKMAKEAATEMQTWTDQELARFLAFTSDDRYGPAWLFLATTGMRREKRWVFGGLT
jgi:hypothetical protein